MKELQIDQFKKALVETFRKKYAKIRDGERKLIVEMIQGITKNKFPSPKNPLPLVAVALADELTRFLDGIFDELFIQFSKETTPDGLGDGIVGELTEYNRGSGFSCTVDVPATPENNVQLFNLMSARHIYLLPVQRTLALEKHETKGS
jgi:hypothetical protein